MLAEDQNAPSASCDESPTSSFSPVKSYDNKQWMHTRGAREIRILCEYLEVRDRLRANGILSNFVVFGSARTLDADTWQANMKAAKEAAASSNPDEAAAAAENIKKLERIAWACEWYDKTRILAKMLMTWVQTEEARKAIAAVMSEIPLAIAGDNCMHSETCLKGLQDGVLCAAALCTGGGFGMMEAANRGASEVPGARSVGMGMSLPFESSVNKFVDRNLAFKFHYFFTRKFWMTYTALAVIAAPGGVGTLDELMEIITLKQCRKLKRDIPIILFGKSFWKRVIHFDVLVEMGMMAASDLDDIFMTDDPEEAFAHLRNVFLSGKLLTGSQQAHKSMRRELEALRHPRK